ncbi:unnamed protein product [Closterium sp. NIES-64]|nr:unnamed protein product [Closterium sp. NIES-64]
MQYEGVEMQYEGVEMQYEGVEMHVRVSLNHSPSMWLACCHSARPPPTIAACIQHALFHRLVASSPPTLLPSFPPPLLPSSPPSLLPSSTPCLPSFPPPLLASPPSLLHSSPPSLLPSSPPRPPSHPSKHPLFRLPLRPPSLGAPLVLPISHPHVSPAP